MHQHAFVRQPRSEVDPRNVIGGPKLMTHAEIVTFLIQRGIGIKKDDATGDVMMGGEALTDRELVNLANGNRSNGSPEIKMVTA